ncbi:MAG: alpha-E domain-containing protein [Candidatus Dormibacteria bacterium]
MLSRAAGALYRVGRDLERADHLARLLDVHQALWLDRGSDMSDDFWARLDGLAGWPPAPARRPRQTVENLVSGTGGPSIQGCMEAARRGALAFRPSLASEVFEQLNILYWQLEEADRKRDLHGLLTRVQLGVHLVFGLIDGNMAHDEVWDFITMGRQLERAENVTRLVTRKTDELDDAEPIEWAAVLRCCSALEAYRMRYSAPVTAGRVARFLLLDRDLPRSAAHCIRQALVAVSRIDPPGQRSRPHRLLGQLAAMLDYADEGEVAADPRGFAATFHRLSGELEEALVTTYFQPSKVPSDVAPPLPAWAQPQQ